jgi:GTP-binding protein HflX
VKNELFATLDPTARKFEIEGIEFLLVDTVGFLQDLPHNLIEAFKSTLESALNCDLALIVCDAQGEYEMQLETTLNTLRDMEFSAPYLTVLNKCEEMTDSLRFPRDSVMISAKTGLGIDELKKQIVKAFSNDFYFCELFIPYAELNAYAKIKTNLTERNVEFLDDGQKVNAVIPSIYADLFTKYIVRRFYP